MRLLWIWGALALLAGCGDSDTTWTEQEANASAAQLAGMWGPCRSVALERVSDARAAGLDAETLDASLSRTYEDCVAADKKSRFDSVYDGPPPALGAEGPETKD